MPSTVEQIKSRLNIADIVGSYIKLEKAGANFKARCPFHNEKTPSFFVSPTRESYHCFGCDKGGDMISFVEEIEGMDFMEALKILADKAGVEISREDRGHRSEKGKLLALMKDALNFFKLEIRKNKGAVDYLLKRGLTKDTIVSFEIGFAPNDWRTLNLYLQKKGYSEKEMETVGLQIKSEKGYYDRFRSRIMFPIKNMSGAVIGFTGRIFEPEKSKNGGEQACLPDRQAPAKYINSPQTILYDKSRALFGIEKAKLAMRQKDECILVEGQMDLIMSHQAGVDNAVAVSGTALSSEHLKTISALSNRIVIAFDGDLAGFSAASGRAVDLALSNGMDVRLAILSEEKDPADLILKNSGAWELAVKNAIPVVDFCIESLLKRNLEKDELAKEMRKIVLPHLRSVENKIDQSKYIRKISELLGVNDKAITEELNKIQIASNASAEEKKVMFMPSEAQRQKIEARKKKIWAIIEWQKNAKTSFGIENAKKKFTDVVGEEESERLDKELSPKKNELTLEAEIVYSNSKEFKKDFENLLDLLQEDILKVKLGEEAKGLKLAEKKGDSEEIEARLNACKKITENFKKLRR